MDKLLEEIKKIRKEIKELKKKKKLKTTKAKIKSKTKTLREKKEKISTKYLTNPVQPAQIPMQINPNPYGDNLRQIARNYLAPAIPVVPNNQLVVVPPPPQVPQLPQLPPPPQVPQLPRPLPPLLSAKKKRKSRLKQAVIYDKTFLMKMTLTNLRLEIKKHFPGKYTDAELKKITGKNREKVIDQYFNAELPQEEDEDEDAQDLYANHYNPADNAFAYVNPMLYSSNFSSDIPSTPKNPFPSDATPQKYPPKRQPLPLHTEDFDNDDSEEEEDDDEAIKIINKTIKSNKKAIADIKAFSSYKGQSSQTPLSSDIVSFGTQGAYSQPVFDNDESIYTKSFVSGLEDDEKHFKTIRAMEKEATKRRNSRIPKTKKFKAQLTHAKQPPSIRDERENNEDDDHKDVFPTSKDS
jgi:hypothetical protein